MCKLKFLFMCLLGSCLQLQAQQVILVSPQGCDASADGTPANPFASLSGACRQALKCEGTDTLFIQLEAGRYPLLEPIEFTESPQRPLVICGCERDDEPVSVLSGGVRIGGWKEGANGIWTTHVQETEQYGFVFEQLYVNGRRSQRAKTPDSGWFFIEESSEVVHFRGNGRSPEYATQRYKVGLEDLSSLEGVRYEEANGVMAMFYHHWDNTRKYLSYIKPDSSFIYTNGKGLKSWNPITHGSRYVLENYRNALTAPGEWFLDRCTGELSYIPREGEDMTVAEVYAPAVPTLLTIKGTSSAPVRNISFRNLSFEHSAYVMPVTGNDGEQAAASVPATILLDYAEGVSFDHCAVRHTGNYALWFRKACTDCSLTHSLLTDLGAGGIKIGQPAVPDTDEITRGILVENNIIQKTGNVFPCGVGVAVFHSPYNRIIHNEISNLMYSGISIGWVWGYGPSLANHNEVAYNHIHHVGWGELSDMGAVYTLGVSPGTHIHHNVIHDVYSYDYGGWGLYTDEGSTGVVMEDNLVYACKNGAFHQHYGRENIIRNNIFAFGLYNLVQLTRVEDHKSFDFTNNILLCDYGVMMAGPWDKANLVMQSNLYWDLRSLNPDFLNMKFKEWKSVRNEKSLLADPQFVNPQAGDFRFKNMRNARRIGFKPFDYSKAGVYGSPQWREKAQMPKEEIDRFDRKHPTKYILPSYVQISTFVIKPKSL